MEAQLRDLQRREAEAQRLLEEFTPSSLILLHQRHAAVVAMRVGGDRPVPQGFADLVNILAGPRVPRCEPPPEQAGEPAENVARSRTVLRERQADVRRAPADGLPNAVALRDHARVQHVAVLKEALEATLAATRRGRTLEELDSAIVEAAGAIERTEAALATARNAIVAEPMLGTRATPPRSAEGGILSSAEAAVAAYRQYVRACSSGQVVKATDDAIQMVHEELRSTSLFLQGSGLRPGITAFAHRRAVDGSRSEDVAIAEVVRVTDEEVVVRFSGGTEEESLPRSWAVERHMNDDVAVASLDGKVSRARSAIDAECSFWMGLDQVATMPCSQLLTAGRCELDACTVSVSRLRAARAQHVALSAELKDESRAMTPDRSRDPALRALAAASDEHLDASDALQDALQAVHRARVRKRPVEELEGLAAEKKHAAKQADASVRRAMLDLAEALRLFPEVGRDAQVQQHLRLSIPPDLVPLWCLGRTMAHFDRRELLPTASKHRLYCAWDGDKRYAVKEYALVGGSEGLSVCLHEAAILTRARHPHIVEICALFADTEAHGFFIQMPFYESGSLDRWFRDQKPDDLSVRRVLAQVVMALAHLHGLGIVHADVKPGNILMDGRGVARLGDFDMSADSSTRTSVARAHATMTQVGYTQGYAAPELLRTGASAATDMYALGATLAEVTSRSPERDRLLLQLQVPDPEARPTADQVLRDPFFTPAFEWVKDERRSCCICLEDGVHLEAGLECGRTDGQPHFVCAECLEGHVQATVGQELRLRQAAEGRVGCPGRPCDASCYPDVDLARRLSAAVFHRYTESRLDLLEQRRSAELEGELQARLDAELRRLQQLDERQRRVRAVRNHIVEEILTLKCPRCGQAFLDFVGCFALQCSRCPCGFCAWCGADSGGRNAHDHVRTCREKPPGADVFFGTFEQFEQAQRRRRRRVLERYLPTLERETRQWVQREMRRDFADLGLADVLGGPMAA